MLVKVKGTFTGVTSGNGVVEYPRSHQDGAAIAGGAVKFTIVGGQVKAEDGVSDLMVLGSAVGEAAPPVLRLVSVPAPGTKPFVVEFLPVPNAPEVAANVVDVNKPAADARIILPSAEVAGLGAAKAGALSARDAALAAAAQAAAGGAAANAAAAQAAAAAGLIAWAGGDHTTLPAVSGIFRILNGTEAGQIWQRVSGGAAAVRRADLEAASATNVVKLADRAVAGGVATLDANVQVTWAQLGLYYVDALRVGAVNPLNTAAANTVGLQALFDSVISGTTIVIPPLDYQMAGAAVYLSGKSNIRIEMTGARLLIASGGLASIVVHGGTIDRTLTGSAWGLQLLSMPYESVTPVKNVIIRGGTIQSSTGSRVSSMVFFVFADDSGLDGTTIRNSNGNGIELRYCARPILRNKWLIEDCANYGIFNYQSYAPDWSGGTIRKVGRAWEIKQRHKLYDRADLNIRDILVEDCTPSPTPAWFTVGISFRDLIRGGFAQDQIDNHNFTGHEIVRGGGIRNIVLRVTSAATASTNSPCYYIGAFADHLTVDVRVESQPTATVNNPTVIIGGAGDTQDGVTYGATFGDSHVITGEISGVNNPNTNSALFNYAVNCTIQGVKVRNCLVQQILTQWLPSTPSPLPFGSIDRVQWLDNDVTVSLTLAGITTQGVLAGAETKLFRTGGNKLTITPVDNGLGSAYTVCNPVCILAQEIDQAYRDTIVVLPNAASQYHATTYAMYVYSPRGRAGRVDVTVTPANSSQVVRGLALGVANSETTRIDRAIVLDAGSYTLVGTASASSRAVNLDREAVMLTSRSAFTFTGTWATTIQDNIGRTVSQNQLRVLTGTTPPTTGTFSTGDRFRVTGLGAGQVAEYVNIVTSTEGGTNPSWIASSLAGYRTSNSTPTFSAQVLGEFYYDQVAKRYWRAIGVGGGAADWVPASIQKSASITWDPPSIAAGASVTKTITATAAAVGDFAQAAPEGGIEAGLVTRADVTSAGVVTMTITNVTAAAIDPASRVWRVIVTPQ